MRLTVWDPGMSTGVVEATIEADMPIRILDAYQIRDGIRGVIMGLGLLVPGDKHRWIVERFRVTPRTYRSVELEPLRIEGALMLANPDIVFQYNDAMLLAGGGHGSSARNKQAADNVLRGLGLWHTGKMIGDKDANDVNSAMKHLVAYARGIGHKPTLEALNAL